jgi:glycosyltransferase involved in cell wall biosynthesis
MKALRVGLLSGDLAGWGGGRDFLQLLASGLSETGYCVTLLVPKKGILSFAHRKLAVCRQALKHIARLQRPRLAQEGADGAEQVLEAMRCSGCDFDLVTYSNSTRGLNRAVAKHAIDVVMPCLRAPGHKFSGRWIGYIFDLQHKYMPQFFSHEAIAHRDRSFGRILAEARSITVNSQQVKNDIEKFYGRGLCSITPLPFGAVPQLDWLTEDTDPVLDRYAITYPFFLISNQFWLHKDHSTAFLALSLLPTDKVHLICTGNTEDYRDKEYFPRLLQLIDKLGLGERVHILGHIPKLDQIAIMRRAVAVIQPTLFEGGPGGGSVYQAVAVGVPAIVSDIPINQEICDEDVVFFRAGSPEHLADEMKKMFIVERERPSIETLLDRAKQRKNNLSRALKKSIDLLF